MVAEQQLLRTPPEPALVADEEGLVKLELPDIPADWWEVDAAALAGFEPPPAAAGMQGGLFQALCSRMMTDIHRNSTMSQEEREASLRRVLFPIPSSPPGRTLQLLEDPKGVLCAGSTGAVVWPAALALVQRLDGQIPSSSSRPPRSAVDLGAGLGAVGLFLGVYKSLRVVVSEMPEAVPLLQRSVDECLSTAAAAAGGAGKADVKAAPLLWGDTSQMAPLGTFDLVVGSDVTYRQECLDDLLHTAGVLLAPGGKFLLALQDRHGEADNLEEACRRRDVEVVSKDMVDIKESDADLRDIAARDYCKGEDAVVKVWLYDLAPASLRAAPAVPAPAGSPEDVEAEFERLTGIRPEKLIPSDFRRAGEPSPRRPEAAAGEPESATRMKTGVVKDMLDRGLGDYLCDMDEELRHVIEEQPPERRPRTAKQKQAFAAAFYAGEAPPPGSVPARALESGGPEEARVAAVAGGGSSAYRPPPRQELPAAAAAAAELPEPAAEAAPDTPEAPAQRPKIGGGSAKLCLPGLVWDVDVAEPEQRLTATVSFGEEAWWALQGSTPLRGETNATAFKEAIDFQLSDKELRVLHAGTAVLELELPFAVDAGAAAAKLCSRRRRVVVRAPLRR